MSAGKNSIVGESFSKQSSNIDHHNKEIGVNLINNSQNVFLPRDTISFNSELKLFIGWFMFDGYLSSFFLGATNQKDF